MQVAIPSLVSHALGACLLIVVPAPAAHAGPTPIGVAYGTHWQQSMHIYPAIQNCQPAPLAIYIHGGGWLSGDSTHVQPYVQSLLNRGFAIASLNYRWSTNAIFPAQIHDCKGAVRFLRDNATTYNIDPDRFVAFGDSAGGHLAALLGTSGGVASLEGNVGGNLEHSSSVSAVGDFYGPTDLFALGVIHNGPQSMVSQLFGHWIQDIIDHMNHPPYADLVALVHSANPITHITADDPPFRIAHGEDDTFVPPSQSQILHDALVQAGVPSTLIIVPGFGHELPDSQYQITFDFLANLVGATPLTDINCDGVVNIDDLLAVIGAWGACPTPPQPCPADVTLDGAVDIDDMLAVIGDWG